MTLDRSFARSLLRLATCGLLAVSLGLVVAVPRASAQAGVAAPKSVAVKLVNADVMILHATQTDGGAYIDPLIGNLPQLSKPPFSAYNSYKLLDRKSLALEKGKSATYNLVNGRVLQVTFIEPTDDKRFHVAASINQPGGSAFLKLLEVKAAPNETFFVGGQAYKGGSLVLGITMRP